MPEFCCSSTGPKSDLEGEREREGKESYLEGRKQQSRERERVRK